jgi:hypothetical protein
MRSERASDGRSSPRQLEQEPAPGVELTLAPGQFRDETGNRAIALFDAVRGALDVPATPDYEGQTEAERQPVRERGARDDEASRRRMGRELVLDGAIGARRSLEGGAEW